MARSSAARKREVAADAAARFALNPSDSVNPPIAAMNVWLFLASAAW